MLVMVVIAEARFAVSGQTEWRKGQHHGHGVFGVAKYVLMSLPEDEKLLHIIIICLSVAASFSFTEAPPPEPVACDRRDWPQSIANSTCCVLREPSLRVSAVATFEGSICIYFKQAF